MEDDVAAAEVEDEDGVPWADRLDAVALAAAGVAPTPFRARSGSLEEYETRPEEGEDPYLSR